MFAQYSEDLIVGNDGSNAGSGIPEFDNAVTGALFSASFDADGLDAMTALRTSNSVTEDTESAIRDTFGTKAEDVQFEFSDQEILVTGRFSNETLQNP